MRSVTRMYKIEKCGENVSQIAINHTLLLIATLKVYKPIRMDYWYPKYSYTCIDLNVMSPYIKCLTHLLHSCSKVSYSFYSKKFWYIYL